MGDISTPRISYGLSATGTPSRAGVAGTASLGRGSTLSNLTGGDIFYTFTITGDSDGDIATLTLTSGAVAQTSGTPDISNSAVDFEGRTLVTAVTGLVMLVEHSGSGYVDVASSSSDNPDTRLPAGGVPLLCPITISGTIAFTLSTADNVVTVTIAAKST